MPLVAKRVQQGWRRQGWRDPRLVVTLPYFLPVARELGFHRTVYYAVDNYQADGYHANWPKGAAEAQENELIRNAVATLAASSELANWFRERAPSAAAKIHYLPNGARPDMILPSEAIKTGPLALRADLASRFGAATGPVVGVYGETSPGHGIEFLAAVVDRSPSFRFLVMGPVIEGLRGAGRETIERLRRCPNVVMTGHLREPESFEVLRQCDVMAMALSLDAHIYYTCPVRLWTYMATGRPIVSTPIPEVMKFGELVRFAADADEFALALRDAATERDADRAAKRIQVAKAHAWPALAQRLWEVL